MIFVVELIKHYRFYKIKRKFVSSNNIFRKESISKISSYLCKIQILKKIDIYLNKLGNPYGLNIVKYVLLKILLIIFFSTMIISSNVSIFVGILVVLCAFFLVDILLILNQNSLNSKIQKDFIHIVDNVYLQMSSNIPINKILKKLHINCKTPVLKQSLIAMSNTYEYTGYNMHTAVLELKDRFNLVEVDMFCSALIEQTVLGENLALFENLSTMLYEKSFKDIKKNTRYRIIMITIGIAITLLNISLLVFYPIMYSFSQSFSNIFY